jgi:hypothetical protein
MVGARRAALPRRLTLRISMVGIPFSGGCGVTAVYRGVLEMHVNGHSLALMVAALLTAAAPVSAATARATALTDLFVSTPDIEVDFNPVIDADSTDTVGAGVAATDNSFASFPASLFSEASAEALAPGSGTSLMQLGGSGTIRNTSTNRQEFDLVLSFVLTATATLNAPGDFARANATLAFTLEDDTSIYGVSSGGSDSYGLQSLSDIVTIRLFLDIGESLSFSLLNDADAFASATDQPSIIPLPAGLPLMLAALGGFVLVRRRARDG